MFDKYINGRHYQCPTHCVAGKAPGVWPLSTPCWDSPNWLLPGQGQVSVGSGLVDGDGGALEEAWGGGGGGGVVSGKYQPSFSSLHFGQTACPWDPGKSKVLSVS